MTEKRVTYQGMRTNVRTRDMFLEAERLCGFNLTITQGSYSGKVSASAGTHDGGGALDVRARDLSSSQRYTAVKNLRRVGFAAWLRNPSQGSWPWHIHCIAIGDDDLSRGAKNQVTSYKNGHNGLAGNGEDDGPSGYRLMTWEYYNVLKNKARPGTPTKDVTMSATALNMAAAGKPISHSYEYDAEQFMAFAYSGLKVIPETTFSAWRSTRKGEFFKYAVKCVQAKGGLVQDGFVGPMTARYIERFGYQVIS